MKYGKSLVAALTAAVVVAYQALGGDQHISSVEWVSVAIALVTALGVYVVPMAPYAKWTKTGIAVILSVLQILTSAILGGLGTDELLLMLITAVGAAGIYIAPAVSENPDGPDVVVTTGSDV